METGDDVGPGQESAAVSTAAIRGQPWSASEKARRWEEVVAMGERYGVDSFDYGRKLGAFKAKSQKDARDKYCLDSVSSIRVEYPHLTNGALADQIVFRLKERMRTPRGREEFGTTVPATEAVLALLRRHGHLKPE